MLNGWNSVIGSVPIHNLRRCSLFNDEAQSIHDDATQAAHICGQEGIPVAMWEANFSISFA
jgi:hypothetical protein